MSWSRRHILLAPLALTACGFSPVLGPGSAAPRGAFALKTPETPLGFALLGRLEDRLGPPDAPRYLLSVRIDLDEATSVVTDDQETQRYTLVGRAHWTLSESGTERATGTVDSFASYSASGTTVATESARDDAEERLATGLADRIVTRVWATLP
ncbi:MAG: hypothetical protein CSA72_10825 [Rhodobacterales bacterium]|nr:MAG: hypothetical protein CSA72_10825 [Rhodobacterales bacterium]